jgi:hypothetical protein
MSRRLKLVLLSLSAILVAVGIYIVPPLYRGYSLDREFLSHTINKQMLDRYSDLAAGRNSLGNRFDVTDIFPENIKRIDFEHELEAIGYVCKGDSAEKETSFSLCSSEAGYTFVCGKRMLLTAEFGAEGTATKIDAWYMLTCL